MSKSTPATIDEALEALDAFPRYIAFVAWPSPAGGSFSFSRRVHAYSTPDALEFCLACLRQIDDLIPDLAGVSSVLSSPSTEVFRSQWIEAVERLNTTLARALAKEDLE